MKKNISYLVIVFLLASSSVIKAGEIPNNHRDDIEINARSVDLRSLLNSIFNSMKVPVKIATDIKGVVSGKWNTDGISILSDLSDAHSVVYYYDGQIAHVYNKNAIVAEVLPIDQSIQSQIIDTARRLRILDANHSIKKLGIAGLAVSGTPRFADQVNEIVTAIKKNRNSSVTSSSARRNNATNEVGALTTEDLSERIFYLKYASVQDTTMDMNGSSVRVPGIASILSDIVSSQPIPIDIPKGDNSESSVNKVSSLTKMSGADETAVGSVGDYEVSHSRDMSNVSTKIVPIARLNAVLIRDRVDRLASFAKIIESLDVEQHMIEIEATIIDIDTSASRDLGINLSYSDGTGNDVSSLTRPSTGVSNDQLFSNTIQGGVLSLAVGRQTELFLSRIKALEKKGDAEIISRPRITTLSNVEAVIDASETFYVRVSSTDDASLFKISTGTVLRVTPNIFMDSGKWKIKLVVNIQDGATSSATVDQIPVVGTTNINTQAIVVSGDSLLIGGMAREISTKSEDSVPLLGKLPAIGALFRNTTTTNNKVERMFLLSPKLVKPTNRATLTEREPLASTTMNNRISKFTSNGEITSSRDMSVTDGNEYSDKKMLNAYHGDWSSLSYRDN